MVWTLLRRAVELPLMIGPIPEHVAFIMDGNRRFADREHIDKLSGHTQGYSKMIDVIHWCLELGVPYVTVYAFSIDNFKRSPGEVGSLMHLAEDKFAELMQDDGLAEREGVEVRILGDLTLVPPSVQGAAARLMRATAALRHKRAVLNICFSYTATEEVVAAVDAVQQAVQTGQLQPGDVTPQLLQRCMHTESCPPVDLLIRTSGETRLSDFLLWQTSAGCAQLAFVDKLWPDFGFTDFARCIMQYQRNHLKARLLKQEADRKLAGASSSRSSSSACMHRGSAAGCSSSSTSAHISGDGGSSLCCRHSQRHKPCIQSWGCQQPGRAEAQGWAAASMAVLRATARAAAGLLQGGGFAGGSGGACAAPDARGSLCNGYSGHAQSGSGRGTSGCGHVAAAQSHGGRDALQDHAPPPPPQQQQQQQHCMCGTGACGACIGGSSSGSSGGGGCSGSSGRACGWCAGAERRDHLLQRLQQQREAWVDAHVGCLREPITT